jgi:serine/threonine protein kinase
MDFTKIKIIKKLGAGMFGTVYLIEYDNKQYAMKIQKILELEKIPDYKHTIWREIFFYKDVKKMPKESKKFFCRMYAYKILDNCKHKQVRSKDIAKNSIFAKKYYEMNASNICAIFIIDYKGNTNLYDYLQTSITSKQIYSILLQVCKIILLLSDIKYSHNDLNPSNIIVHPTKDKTFEIKGNQINYNGIQLVAIDYGNMTNKSYGPEYFEDQESFYFFELTKFLFYILQNTPKLEKNCRIQKKKYPYEIEKNYKNNFWRIIFEKHKRIVDNYAKKYLRLYPHLREFYFTLKKNIQNSSMDDIKKGINYKNDINVFFLKIENHFALEHPEEYMKITGWCSNPEYILPKKDILEILLCKTRDDYVKFFQFRYNK